MSDRLTNIVRSDILGQITTFIMPGIVSATPYLMLFNKFSPSYTDLILNLEVLATTIIIIIILGFGFLSDTLGSTFESYFLDSRRKKENPKFMDNWYLYLRLAFEPEPIGQRYLRKVLMHLKFELNIAVGIILFYIGYLIIYFTTSLTNKNLVITSSVSLVLVTYLIFEVDRTSKMLATIREKILLGTLDQNTNNLNDK